MVKNLNLGYLTKSVNTYGKCLFVTSSWHHNFLFNFVTFDQYSEFRANREVNKTLQLFIQTVLTHSYSWCLCITLLIKTFIFTRSPSSLVSSREVIKPIFPSSWTDVYVLMCYYLIFPYHFKKDFSLISLLLQKPLLSCACGLSNDSLI